MIEYTVKVNDDGDKYWYFNGKLHRVDGPAVEYVHGHKEWWLNGKLHRVDGPAVELDDGTKEWYLNGEKLTESAFNALQKTSCHGKVVEIDGKKYQLQEIK